MTLRGALKGTVERGIVLAGGPRVARRRVRRGTLILAYHNVLPPGERPGGDQSLHLPLAEFERQLDALVRTHDVIPLDALVRRAGPPAGGRPRAVITFDDAYRGAVTAGVAALAARALPATIFVTPSFLGGRAFWWDEVGGPPHGRLTPSIRAHALGPCAGDDGRVRAWIAEEGHVTQAAGPYARCGTLDELRTAADTPGITLGSHTWSHPNLTRLAGDELMAELVRPLHWLRERFTGVLAILAYPYGATSAATEAAAAAAGYEAALRVDGGWLMEEPSNPMAVPRYNVPAGLSIDGFALRTAGLWCR